MMDEEHVKQDDQTPKAKNAFQRIRQRWWFRGIVYVITFYIVWCLTLFFYQDQMLFPADMAPEPSGGPADPSITVHRLEIESGGKVESWFIPAKGISRDEPGPVVVFFHGNAEIIDYQQGIVPSYLRMGCSVLLPEYRGYGRSAGKPSEKGIVADAVRFYDEMLKREDVDTSRIVIHGRSLGGGVAAQLATRRKPAALILESTFCSVAEMAHDYFAPEFLAKHPFYTDRVLPGLDIPILIFHGSRDDIIPVEHGRRLKNLAPDAVYVEYDCNHNDFPCMKNLQAYWGEIQKFLTINGIVRQLFSK